MGDILQVQGINEKGFGIIPKLVMQDKRLTAEAKAIYSYFCSYAGAGRTAFPSRNKIVSDLGMSVKRYYRHFRMLTAYGYIKAEQEKSDTGQFKRNIYTLMQEIPYSQNDNMEPCSHFPYTGKAYAQNDYTNNNSIKSNSINNNSLVSQDGQDVTDAIKRNIDYSSLAVTHKADIRLIDEMILIMVDCLTSIGDYVRINGDSKPRTLVNGILLTLTYENIEHAVDRFKSVSEPIKNKRQYILTLLYNSKMETDSHMQNLYESNKNGGY